MGGRDHSCEGCGNGGFNNDLPCECEHSLTTTELRQAIEAARERIDDVAHHARKNGYRDEHHEAVIYGLGCLLDALPDDQPTETPEPEAEDALAETERRQGSGERVSYAEVAAETPEPERCGCCGRPIEPRDPDPWGGRLDSYCEDCATARCDAYPGACHDDQPERGKVAEEDALSREPCDCPADICAGRWDQEHYCRQPPTPSPETPAGKRPEAWEIYVCPDCERYSVPHEQPSCACASDLTVETVAPLQRALTAESKLAEAEEEIGRWQYAAETAERKLAEAEKVNARLNSREAEQRLVARQERERAEQAERKLTEAERDCEGFRRLLRSANEDFDKTQAEAEGLRQTTVARTPVQCFLSELDLIAQMQPKNVSIYAEQIQQALEDSGLLSALTDHKGDVDG